MNAQLPTAAQWPEISRLLDDVLALPPSERDAWLARLAVERPAHHDTLRGLLDTLANMPTDDFLNELPRLDVSDTARSAELHPGQLVAVYRLLHEIGRGGMGTVWLAERSDGVMKRRVALKLPWVVWGDAFADRIGRERDILASLEHEHVARLYDAGVDAHGRPFLAMEYVEGETIDVHCRTRALPLDDRIALLLQVMAAVSHAHARLVVHRDLKPGNILVNAHAQVKLLDFGVAKLLEGDHTQRTRLTELAGRALTPDYASPEQIRGEPLRTTSDVYSMAVVAYELLSGSRPYRLKRGTAAELEEAIATVEPPLASSGVADKRAARALRGDIDSILNKALKKHPDERYPTMDAFAHDLRRYLAGEPVEARPDSRAYRAAKFVRRHRLQAAAGTLVAVALVVGTSVALWQAREARLQARRAQAEAVTAQAVQTFLEGVFRANTADQDDPKKARDTTARELLDRGAERVDGELARSPEARLRMLGVLASLYEGMVILDKEVPLRRKLLEQSRAVTGATSDETVTAMAQLAHALVLSDQRPEATTLLKDAAAILDARRDDASQARFRVDVMQASLDRRGDARHGLVAADRAIAIARRGTSNADLVQALQMKADNAHALQDYARARDAYAELIHICEAHPPMEAGSLSIMYESLGDSQGELGQYVQAEQSIRKGIEIDRRRDPQSMQLQMGHTFLSIFLRKTGRLRESVEAMVPVIDWTRSPAAASLPAYVHVFKVRNAAALLAYGRSRDALAQTDGDSALTVAAQSATGLDMTTLALRARALTDLHRLADARVVLDRGRALLAQVAGKLPSAAIDDAERGWLVANGQAEQALASFHAARVAAKLAATPDAKAPVGDLVQSAGYELAAGHHAAARLQAEQALAAIDAGGNAAWQRDQEARASLLLGKASLRGGQAREAGPVLERAVLQHRAVFDPQHSSALADALLALADARRSTGARGEAALVAEATRIQAASRSD